MAAINFPSNPTTGQQYTQSGMTWLFNGSSWTVKECLQATSQDAGIMLINTYDKYNRGVVDNAQNLGGNPPSYYRPDWTVVNLSAAQATIGNSYYTYQGGTGTQATITSNMVGALGGGFSTLPFIFSSGAGVVKVTANSYYSVPVGNTFTYQWQRGAVPSGSNPVTWVNISGATSSTYTLNAADVGNYVQVIVTQLNVLSTVSTYYYAYTGGSGAYATITNDMVGGTGVSYQMIILSEGNGTVSAALNTYYSLTSGYTLNYQWQRASNQGALTWSNITGATSSSYTLQNADLSYYIQLVVTVTASGSTISTNYYTYTNSYGTLTPITSTMLGISGGQSAEPVTLTSGNGVLVGSLNTYYTIPSGYTLSYAWQRAPVVQSSLTWTSIGGASGSFSSNNISTTYTLSSVDVGNYLQLVVTLLSGSTVVSTYTYLYVDGTGSIAPIISKMLNTGGITVSPGALSSGNGVLSFTLNNFYTIGSNKFTYQWQRASSIGNLTWVNISGATSNNYQIQNIDVGNYVRVVVSIVGGGVSNFNIANYQEAVCDTSGGSFNITLPAPGTTGITRVKITDIYAANTNSTTQGFGANAVILLAPSGYTIYGASSFNVNKSSVSPEFRLYGTDWEIESGLTNDLVNNSVGSVTYASVNATTVSTGDLETATINRGPLSGMRNRIINGAMDVAQRGINATVPAGNVIPTSSTGYYNVDRWFIYSLGAGITVSQNASTAGLHSLQLTGASGVTQIGVGQRIEQANSYDMAGQVVTLSANMSNSLLSSVTWTVSYALPANLTPDIFGTIANGSKVTAATGTWTVTSSPTVYSAAFLLPTNAFNGVEVLFTVGSQVSGTWNITNVQLEIGGTQVGNAYAPQATAFERRSIQQELLLCKRYYSKTFDYGIVPAQNTGYISGALSCLTGSILGSSTPIVSISNTGNTANLTYTGTTQLFTVVGQTVTVAGVTPAGYNGTYTATSVGGVSGAWTVSYTISSSNLGNQTVAGTVTATYPTSASTTAAANNSSNSVTLTYSGTTQIFTSVGQSIYVSGVTPTGYNGTYTVTGYGGSSGAWTVTYANSTTGYVSGGTVSLVTTSATAATSGRSSGTTATLTYTSATQLFTSVGQQVAILGVTPSGYNGTYNVTAVGGSSGAWTVSYTTNLSNIGNQTVAGTVSLYYPTATARSIINNPSTTATLTYNSLTQIFNSLGQIMTVSGVTPSGYNGTYAVTGYGGSSGAWTVSYTNSTTGYISSGTVALISTASSTAGSSSGTTATLTYSGTIQLFNAVGQTITVSGITPSGYNGTYAVTAVGGVAGAWTVSYTTSGSNIGSQTVAGTLTLVYPTSASTSAATNPSSIATLTYGGTSQGYVAGQSITVSGVTPTGYNGTYTITAVGGSSGAWTVSYPSTTTGSQTVAGSFISYSYVGNALVNWTYPITMKLTPTVTLYTVGTNGSYLNSFYTTASSPTGTGTGYGAATTVTQGQNGCQIVPASMVTLPASNYAYIHATASAEI